MADVLKTSQEWHDAANVRWPQFYVIDADGWDRSNFEQSWNEPITENEFWNRVATSTCCWPVDMNNAIADGSFLAIDDEEARK